MSLLEAVTIHFGPESNISFYIEAGEIGKADVTKLIEAGATEAVVEFLVLLMQELRTERCNQTGRFPGYLLLFEYCRVRADGPIQSCPISNWLDRIREDIQLFLDLNRHENASIAESLQVVVDKAAKKVTSDLDVAFFRPDP